MKHNLVLRGGGMTNSRPKAAKIILALIAIGVVVLGIFCWEQVWMLVITTEVPIEWKGSDLELIRGRSQVKRWDRDRKHGRTIAWYVKTGWKAHESEHREGTSRQTYWNFNGTVNRQLNSAKMRLVIYKRSPPWLWDVTDQSEPTAPWWKEKK